jgi:hypothetical protein
VGYGINCRPLREGERALRAVDARMDCAKYVGFTTPEMVIDALRALQGRPRTEEARPGYAPTAELYDILHGQMKKETYFCSYGANSYLSPGWTPETISYVFMDPSIRAVWLGV